MDDAELGRRLADSLASRRTASLGTLDASGAPHVSMVPFAIEPSQPLIVLHVSGLAAHTAHLRARPEVSLMVVEAEAPGGPVHALHRVTFTGLARVLEPGDPDDPACRAVYLERFPEAEFMTQLTDFRFATIRILSARQIAGFGAARDVALEELRHAMETARASGEAPAGSSTAEGQPG
jgi:hypothetical protein